MVFSQITGSTFELITVGVFFDITYFVCLWTGLAEFLRAEIGASTCFYLESDECFLIASLEDFLLSLLLDIFLGGF